MERKKRIIIMLRIAAIAAVILLLGDIVTGYYLVSFAIGRKDGYVPEPEHKVSDEMRDIIAGNSVALAEKTAAWLDSVKREQVSVTADDGAVLRGDLISPDSGGHLWAILLHGYSRTRERTYNYARFYAEQGYGVIMPDMRGHGESGGEYVGMGWLDRQDVLKWAELPVSRDSQAQIVLHGISMGAATVMMTAGEELSGSIFAAVEDCGYTSVWDIFSDVIHDHTGLPDFPLLHTSDMIGQLRAGYSFREASSLEAVKRSRIPVLFMHGSADTFVHTDMVYRLYDACTSDKDIFIAEGAAHGQAMYADPDAYFEKVFSFISRYTDLTQP